MNKKKTLLFALISILCPVWLVLNIVLVSLTENYFLRNHTDDIFMGLFVVWMPVGWIFGLGTGIAALVFSVLSKKEGKKIAGGLCVSIIGIVLNLLWLCGIIYALPAWMGI